MSDIESEPSDKTPWEGDFSAETEYFDIVREQLQFWPYTIHQIDDSLDASLIEARAKQLLFRAIHARNLTAFIGSGLSMSYGRLNWRNWEEEQRRSAQRQAELFDDLSHKALEWISGLILLLDPNLLRDPKPGSALPGLEQSGLWTALHVKDAHGAFALNQTHKHNVWQWLRGRERAIQAARQRIGRLQKTFELTQAKGGHFPGGEEMPVKFEIAQQLHNELRRHIGLFLPLDAQGQIVSDFDEVKNRSWPGAAFGARDAAPEEGLAAFDAIRKSQKWDGLDQFKVRFDENEQKFDEALDLFLRINLRPEAQLDFEAMSKALLVDECPHAAILLRRGLLRGLDRDDADAEEDDWRLTALETQLDVFNRANQRRDLGGIREDNQRYRVLSPFKFKRAEMLIGGVLQDHKPEHQRWRLFFKAVRAELEDYQTRTQRAGVDRCYLTPSSRYLVPLALSLSPDPFAALGIDDSGALTDAPSHEGAGPLVDGKDPGHPLGPPSLSSFTSRRSILADRYDPMPKIHRDLKVSRYITTNYDFEIERYFQDSGFRHFRSDTEAHPFENDKATTLADTAMRRDDMGRVLRDSCFSPKHAAQLTSFALTSSDSGANVFHLHGRATQQDRLVITERDYMRLYLTDDAHRPTIDESIQVAFSGAPLLFLGLGMEETDLLRPLRQFISNRDRTIGYTSIALLPAEKSVAARAKFSASLYMRYGVHTVFYGSGQMTYQAHLETDGAEPKKYAIDWLHRIIALCNALRDQLDCWEGRKGTASPKTQIEMLNDINDKVGKIGDDIAEDTGAYVKDISALLVLLDRPQSDLEDDAKLQSLIDTLTAVDRDKAQYRLGADKDLEPSWKGTRGPELRTCEFAPTRPSRHRLAHRKEAETRISGNKYVGFYLRQLDRLMTMVLLLAVDVKDKDAKATKAHCAPIRIALDGLQGAFITGSLNAALDGINKEKRAWWKSWQETPKHRLAQFQRLPERGSVEDPVQLETVFLRHKLDNVLTPLSYANDPEPSWPLLEADARPARLAKKNRTHVRAFDTFVAAVACTFAHRLSAADDIGPQAATGLLEREKKQRQLITVAARRGMGKGTFMSAFTTKLGQATYKTAAWPQDDVVFAASIHINLGFSPEIASTYDMLCSALIGVVVTLQIEAGRPGDMFGAPWGADSEKLSKTYRSEQEKLSDRIRRLPRSAGLRDLFRRFSDAASGYRAKDPNQRQPRLLLNICAVDLLFDTLSRPKNREIELFLSMLFSDEFRDYPIDLVVLADDAKLGAPWSLPKGSAPQKRMFLDRAGLDLFADEQIAQALRASRVEMDEETCDRNERLQNAVPSEPLPEPTPPSGAETTPAPAPEPHFIHFTRPFNTAWLLIDNFEVLAIALHLRHPPGGGADSDFDALRKQFSQSVRLGRETSDHATSELWKRTKLPTADETAAARARVREIVSDRVKGGILSHAKAFDVKEKRVDDKLASALRLRLFPDVNKVDADQWRQVRLGLGNSRFSLTLLLAGAENLIIHSESPMESAEEAERLILDTVARARSLGQERRDQLVFETVLETYREFHEIGKPDLDCDLHALIIKHLGVIGTPLGSAVLVRLGEIRDYFSRIGIETETSRRRFIVRALTTMAHRGLVFRLDPHPRLVALTQEGEWPAAQEFRYALHRVVQSFAHYNLEAGPLEPVTTNRFAPTLYSAMPSQGPTLSPRSYQFLRSLIIGLSQYPDVPAADSTAEPWLFTTKNTSIRVQAVRAAVAMARSNFSVAVVSRLAMHEPIVRGVQRRGYLETYRVRLRWLVRIAFELGHRAGSDPTVGPEGPHKHVNALYRDEIVWIYNELGVIALAQGALSDALGYLRQAAEANTSIEGPSHSGPIYNHIDLNHAVVQLERGQFTSAQRRLTLVKEANKTKKRRMHHIAEGYLCVVDHLQGHREGLGDRFRTVTSYLQSTGEDRAAAIFLMHRARFLAKEEPERATELVARARNIAETVGHEDIRHHAELTAIRLRLSVYGAGQLVLNDQKILEDVETFSRRMAIWSLSVDALWVRANILLAQNESMAAGRLLTRAMAITKRHAMTLRLNACLTSYARVLHLRGDLSGATDLAKQSLDMAKRSGYALETARAQNVIRQCQMNISN